MRECGECRACCEGHLLGEAYGNYYGNGLKCYYLAPVTGCEIYNMRPQVCRKYYCAYAQNLTSEMARPDRSKLLVSVETAQDGKQYLKAMEMEASVCQKTLEELKAFVEKHKTELVIVPFNQGKQNV